MTRNGLHQLTTTWTLAALAVCLSSCGRDDVIAPGRFVNVMDDQGDLWTDYMEPENSTHSLEVFQILQESGFYDEQLARLNLTFAFLTDVSIVFSSCDEENAWYDPELSQIVLCYDLIQHYADISHGEYQEDYVKEVIYAGLFTFYHDQHQLPITGQEEDAVDEFAAILLLESQDYDAVIAGMEQFDIDAIEEAESGEELAFWGEHSFSDQRFYTVACLIYGSDPENYEDWVTEDFLLAERAEVCPADYERAQASWDILLEPHRL